MKITKEIKKAVKNIHQGDSEKHKLFNMCKMSIFMLEDLWTQITKAEMQNEQFVLDWLDSINEISIRN